MGFRLTNHYSQLNFSLTWRSVEEIDIIQHFLVKNNGTQRMHGPSTPKTLSHFFLQNNWTGVSQCHLAPA